MKKVFALLMLLMVLLPVLPLQAGESMRCGSNLIVPGNTKLDVLKKCGEPDYIEVISSAIERRTEEWYYDAGAASFPRVLTFEGYRLISIQTVSRR
ncbi:DUF2845 domain-containing protein [Nitrosomonas marina]|uniref:DUF2845 domain-containing protein n=1 Tax=Nitrosomonas marina TaxID=917 RepID=A0A1H8E3K3_9PROT|nr:DUF2845 domain-containing protein [Nitrosomonas marina]SEN14161.1 Protein of unknown function [Nitrosomonas marina]